MFITRFECYLSSLARALFSLRAVVFFFKVYYKAERDLGLAVIQEGALFGNRYLSYIL